MSTGDGDPATPAVALPAPARAQIIALAAEIVATVAFDDLPVTLRPIARFAPAKRARLGGVALAAVLDGDADFRGRVADLVADASPDLTAAVRDAASTAASDPVDVAVVAYLTRPPHWRETLASANERWSAEQGAGGGARQELERLRAEVARLRSEQRGEPARQRDAVARSSAETVDELTELRRRVRSVTGQLRAAERDAAEARAESEAARTELAASAAAHESELRRQRDRMSEAERAAEGARRDVRTGRDLDDARLWLLTDTLIEAARGVRRELSLAPTSMRPADAVGAADPAGPATEVRDAGELDRVLALPHVHLVVDGYNVTKTGYPQLPLADQRTRLLGSLAALGGRTGAETTVVFDGASRPPVQPAAPRGVRVLFSEPGEIADDLIRRLVAAEPPGRPVVVVTSDRAIVRDVARDGARAVASAVLLARLG